jgi:putative Mg2+ transporter-C (MgtC) family protein
MDYFTDTLFHTPWLSTPAIAARLALAALFGAFLGFEREWHSRPAGLRTHILVSLAAACFAIVTIEIAHISVFQSDSIRVDPVRLVEAITAGVAFLAAGMIVFARGEVHGLTTGAGMWLAGAIGLATGLGFLHLAVLSTVFALVVLWILRKVEKQLVKRVAEEDDASRQDTPD